MRLRVWECQRHQPCGKVSPSSSQKCGASTHVEGLEAMFLKPPACFPLHIHFLLEGRKRPCSGSQPALSARLQPLGFIIPPALISAPARVGGCPLVLIILPPLCMTHSRANGRATGRPHLPLVSCLPVHKNTRNMIIHAWQQDSFHCRQSLDTLLQFLPACLVEDTCDEHLIPYFAPSSSLSERKAPRPPLGVFEACPSATQTTSLEPWPFKKARPHASGA